LSYCLIKAPELAFCPALEVFLIIKPEIFSIYTSGLILNYVNASGNQAAILK
jgi:hypothetical protein